MEKRNATVAVIGAGDYIGTEIAKKFAAEGFTVFAGRRDGAKLEPLVRDIEAAGGSIVARSLDAREADEVAAFLADADKHAPLEVCIFNVGANVNFPDWRPPTASFARSGKWPAGRALSPDASRRG
jgi:NAD(P)-dependent dehydrogenase (short-subunit alcohol dehydrogenase family)